MRSATTPLVVVALGLFAGCPPDETGDDDVPPRVVAVEPAATTVPVTTTFTVSFSEELNDKTVDAEIASENITVVLAPRFEADGDLLVNDAFLSDFDNPPLAESRQDDVVSVIASLVRGDSAVTIAPRAPLRPGTAYTLILSAEIRDTSGNPLVDAAGFKAPFIWEFVTDAGPPAVADTDVGDVVVPNRKRITVEFNQPVVGVDTSSLRLEASGGGVVPAVDAILMTADRRTATLVLAEPAAGCERFSAGAAYVLVATSAILGDNGQALEEFAQPFNAGNACDLVPNVMQPPVAVPGETTATIRFTTSKASTTEVRFGVAGGPLDCLGGPCPVVGAFASTPSGAPPSFVHAVEIEGLTLGETYAAVAFAEDDVGFVATRDVDAFTTEELPKVALNELMANPPAGAAEPGDEFIEIASFDDAPLSLEGFVLEIDGGAENDGDTCPLPAGLVLPPRGFLVLVGNAFNGDVYGGVAEAQLVRSDRASFCAALVNSTAQTFALLDAGGRPVSTMVAFAELLPHDDGKSVERTLASAPDVEESWCFSREDTGPTPGGENGVASRGCDE